MKERNRELVLKEVDLNRWTGELWEEGDKRWRKQNVTKKFEAQGSGPGR